MLTLVIEITNATIEPSRVQFGVKSYVLFQNRTRAQSNEHEFDLKSQV